MSRTSPTTSLQWNFSQVFGERKPGETDQDIDIISAIEFDAKGDCLAIGDHGGRVVLFEKTNGKEKYQPFPRKTLENMDSCTTHHPKYSYKTEFQSHEVEFDYLKSLEIGEKINKLRWCASTNNSHFIISTNDRTIKLWKISDKKVKEVSEANLSAEISSENALLAEESLKIEQNVPSVPNGYRLEWINKRRRSMSPSRKEEPKLLFGIDEGVPARCRRTYFQAHDYNINSISNNSDHQSFLSADDLRINLWVVEVANQCFNIIDMKPTDMEDLVEVITAAEFHPDHCNILAYSSSRGFIRLVDMRQSALCDHGARIFQDREVRASRSFFNEIAASISDIKFSKDGRHIISRDYLNLKLWDLRHDSSPISTFNIHEYLQPKLPQMYNDDLIFDKFDCCLSRDGHHFATGTYSNNFKVFSRFEGNSYEVTLEASKSPNRTNLHATQKTSGLLTNFARGLNRRGHESSSLDSADEIPRDPSNKVAHLAWHPTATLIACAAKSSLYLFHA